MKTVTINQLHEHEGQEVQLKGWVYNTRNIGKIWFLIFRDGTGHEFHVLQGASYIDEFVYDRYFDKISLEFPEEVFYLPTISRSNEDKNKNWIGQTGRVNEIVEEYINDQGLKPEDTLCTLVDIQG